MTRAPRLLAFVLIAASLAQAADRGPGPFAKFTLPDEWEAKFWDDPDTKALLALSPKDLAALVPTQSGFRFCRCPACDADEAADPLVWSATRPKFVTCTRCGRSFPNDDVPAKDEKTKKVPEETVEVLRGVTHHYPYHVVPEASQTYPDELLFLDAKRDYEAREALAKAALYAAIRFHEGKLAGKKDVNLARFAAVILLRFAQVYPAYATHFDQPGRPKFLQPADLKPPYRRGYRTGKWEWTGSLEVPTNLVIAHALVRDEPVWDEVGRLLADPNPVRTIEHGFFRAAAEFVRRQTEEFDEQSLQAYRGLFAVGRLLDDKALLDDAGSRVAAFAERGFFHDGYWRQGNDTAHRRVLGQLDGWIERLAGDAAVPMLDLAREAGAASRLERRPQDVELASWPAPETAAVVRRPSLLGGVGLARLSVGGDRDGLDLEVRAIGSLGAPHFQRQALRVSVAGQAVLDDLDALPPTRDGWDLATASHNTVVVDGLNQRESPSAARDPAAGGKLLYYAADPDFQVVAIDDPLAYPRSTTRYRQVVVAAAGPQSRYAVAVFQVVGGLQHDQLFHAPPGSSARWSTTTRDEARARVAAPAEHPVSTRFARRRRPLVRPGLWRVPAARPGSGDVSLRGNPPRARPPRRAAARVRRRASDDLHRVEPRPVPVRLEDGDDRRGGRRGPLVAHPSPPLGRRVDAPVDVRHRLRADRAGDRSAPPGRAGRVDRREGPALYRDGRRARVPAREPEAGLASVRDPARRARGDDRWAGPSALTGRHATGGRDVRGRRRRRDPPGEAFGTRAGRRTISRVGRPGMVRGRRIARPVRGRRGPGAPDRPR